MNADRLLALYDRVAEAPDAIARLRRFVLALAVRGKLVEQDPTDEPAGELLKRLAAEKTRLVKAGVIRREKPLPPLSETDKSFELPNGWAWVRLGNLSQLVTSGSRDWAKHYSNEGAIFVRMGNLSKDRYRLRLEQIQRVNPPPDGEGTRTRLEAGDILISITGDVGMLGLIPEGFGEAYINQHTAMVRPMPEMKGRYLAELFRSPFAQNQFNEPQRGIKNSFRLTDVTQFVVPLPPVAEQHTMVAKVDELMALCDRLEQTRTARQATRDRLTTASLARLSAPNPDAGTFRSHARFTLDALPALTTRPDQIRALRQAILNLAVRGKLVPQDPADEPAPRFDPGIPADLEPPFRIPITWCWARLSALGKLKGGGTPSKARDDFWNGNIPWVSPKDMKALVLKKGAMAEYVLRALKGLKPEMLARVQRSSHGTCRIEGVEYSNFQVPIPPVAEQDLIVAKVDALMALCDRLEANLAAAGTTRSLLLEALLHETLEPTARALEAAE